MPLDIPPMDRAVATGFPAMTDVNSLQSIAHLFGMTKKRSGVYFLKFRSDLFYVGQAIDVVRRFSQHRHVHNDIVGFSFIAVAKSQLDAIEKVLIFKAESLGIKITNAVHVSNVVGDTDFDLIISVAEQDAWLNAASNRKQLKETVKKIALPEIQEIRFSKQFERFNKHPLSKRAFALFKQYLKSCVPEPQLTEYSFWAVSCMPGGNNKVWPRMLCVNAAFMEIFVVGWEKSELKLMWSFVNVAEDVLLEYWNSLDELEIAYPFARIERSNYRDAGQHQVRICCEGGASMEQLLNDPAITKAARTLVLRIMRKRATIFGKYHCSQLADQALSEI